MAKHTTKVATKAPAGKPGKPDLMNRQITKAAPPAKPTTSKALSKPVASTELATGTDFEGMGTDFEGMGTGFEQVTAKDIIIPRIAILQKLSPQIDRKAAEYIEGAAEGEFCDVATNDTFDELELIPCFFARVYLEWAPRSTGKGLIKNHGTNDAIMNETTPDDKGRAVLPNGNYIAETATFYCLNVTAGNRKCFVPLTSTQLKAARRWMTALTAEKLKGSNGRDFTPPMFYRSWRATAVEDSNNEGSWFGWKFEAARPILEIDPSKSLLAEANEFYQQARDGLVTGDVGAAEDGARETVRETEEAM